MIHSGKAYNITGTDKLRPCVLRRPAASVVDQGALSLLAAGLPAWIGTRWMLLDSFAAVP